MSIIDDIVEQLSPIMGVKIGEVLHDSGASDVVKYKAALGWALGRLAEAQQELAILEEDIQDLQFDNGELRAIIRETEVLLKDAMERLGDWT